MSGIKVRAEQMKLSTVCFGENDLSSFRELILKHLPSELKVDLKQVQAIKRTTSGKIRPIISRISTGGSQR